MSRTVETSSDQPSSARCRTSPDSPDSPDSTEGDNR
jgi:hypothetical protein